MKFKSLVNGIYKAFSNFNKSNIKSSLIDELREPRILVAEKKTVISVQGGAVFIGNKDKLLENYKSIIINCINSNKPFTFINNFLTLDENFIREIRKLIILKNYNYNLVVDEFTPNMLANSKFFKSGNSYIFNYSKILEDETFSLMHDTKNIDFILKEKLFNDIGEYNNHDYNTEKLELRALIIGEISDNIEEKFIDMCREFRRFGVQMYSYLEDKHLSLNEKDIFNSCKYELKAVLDSTPNIALLCEEEKDGTYRNILEGFQQIYSDNNKFFVVKLPEHYNYIVQRYKGLNKIYKIQDLSINGDYT